MAILLSSRTRAEFFRLLFGVSSKPMHLREIHRSSGLSLGAIQQEAATLQKLGLIGARKDGNRLYYEANRNHPLFEDIRRMVLKTVGLVDILRETLKDEDGVKCAFVFGSVARGEETAESDIDLIVIGEIGLRRLSGLLSGVTKQLGREVNPHIFSLKEFQHRIAKNEHLVSRVMASPRLFVAGNEDDLEELAK